jgi:hypothetical protein
MKNIIIKGQKIKKYGAENSLKGGRKLKNKGQKIFCPNNGDFLP